jgi:beta-N-acetylhexosaminidase
LLFVYRWNRSGKTQWLRAPEPLVLVFALGALVASEARFQMLCLGCTRETAVAAGADFSEIGRRLIVGYTSAEEVKALIRVGAVGGVFVTARNVRGRTRQEVSREILDLRTTASNSGFGPLIVATDQEGGLVTRLSPPLERPPRLAQAVRGITDPEARRKVAYETGERKGRELASIGVNLNFAPVADLDHGIRNPEDRMSRIGERAVSTDPAIVADVVGAYCDGMMAAGVRCTFKHFPGLGRVANDTHVSSARLKTSRDELDRTDWVPFKRARTVRGAVVMVGHVALDAVEPNVPASLSRPVIDGVLRKELGFEGPVVTDDLCMAAVSDLRGGVAAGVERSLAAGADYALIAYDAAQIYAVLDRWRNDSAWAARLRAQNFRKF